ncbi:protein of unknown function (plasmid) [Azospirillum baldaniorum]|uniref:Uncharacterized protein n=1 Tax=Azospirillum baldaniorum TaxID=1064539 RepID=A0A9P1JXQ0_9PROT|nr:protein of unknown function [Azospirillum baldaniorum]
MLFPLRHPQTIAEFVVSPRLFLP